MLPEWSAAACGWLFTFCASQMGKTGADSKVFAVRITLDNPAVGLRREETH